MSEPYDLTAAEIREMSAKWDPFEFHTDDVAAAESAFSELVASGIHTLAIANLLSHTTGPRWDVLALLSAEYRLPAPARPGELTLTMTATGKRPSSSRPGSGIVTNSMTLRSQHGEIVLEQTGQLLVGPGTS